MIFLIRMALIITKMEEVLKREWPCWNLELPSYLNDLHLGVLICQKEMARGIDIDRILKKVDVIVNGIVAEKHLLLEGSKHERLLLQRKRRKKN